MSALAQPVLPADESPCDCVGVDRLKGLWRLAVAIRWRRVERRIVFRNRLLHREPCGPGHALSVQEIEQGTLDLADRIGGLRDCRPGARPVRATTSPAPAPVPAPVASDQGPVDLPGTPAPVVPLVAPSAPLTPAAPPVISRGAELLRLFRKARGLSQERFADRISRHRRPWTAQTICDWETAAAIPRRENRLRIERLTGGFVFAAAWDQPGEVLRAHAQTDLLELVEATGGGDGRGGGRRGRGRRRRSSRRRSRGRSINSLRREGADVVNPSIDGYFRELKRRLDIVQVARDMLHLELKREGKAFACCCPAHGEKTPSFTVDPNRQRFHCFGCGVGGDVVDLVELIDRIERMEAVERLAAHAGMEPMRRLSEAERQAHEQRRASEKAVFGVLTAFVEHCHQALPDVLRERIRAVYGFTDETIDRYQIGFAGADQFEVLHRFTLDLVQAAGLANGKKGQFPFYNNRILFPHWERGRGVTYIQGRAVIGELAQGVPAELLTPDTEYERFASGEFKKYKGLPEDKPDRPTPVRKTPMLCLEPPGEELIIVEGDPDAIAVAQAGWPAICLSTSKVREPERVAELAAICKRYRRVFVMGDADEARVDRTGKVREPGREGAIAVAQVLEDAGLPAVFLATLPGGGAGAKVDPASFLRDAGERGPEFFREVLARPRSAVEVMIEALPEGINLLQLQDQLRPVFDRLHRRPQAEWTHCLERIRERYRGLVTTKVLDAFRRDLKDRAKSAKKSSAVDQARERILERTPSGPDGQPQQRQLPVIRITTREREVVDRAIDSIADNPASGLYQRRVVLSRIVRAQERPNKQRTKKTSHGEIQRADGTPVIVSATRPNVREEMSAAALWLRQDRDGEWAPAHVPDWAVSALADRGEWPRLRYLEAVVETPVLRADGTLLTKPGYDPDTGLFYDPVGECGEIPDAPSLADAQASRDALLEVVCDFPFFSDEHRSVWLASVLTPLAHFAYTGPAPLFLFDANTRGSGKSLLATATLFVVFGRMPAMVPNADGDDEWRKRILAIALSGDRAVLVDNVAGPFGCASLDAVLTSPDRSWADRVLGKSEQVKVPLVAVWYATGNNVMPAGDLVRRLAHCRLETTAENPEQLDTDGFRHPHLLEWVAAERPRLLAAALTILRAYCVAGMPRTKLPGWGSYDGWSNLVRQAVVWTGMPDPGATRKELEDSTDNERERLKRLLLALNEFASDGRPFTISEVIKAAQKDDTGRAVDERLREALLEFARKGNELPSSQGVGLILKKHRRRVIGGLAIQDGPEDRRGVRTWMVSSLRADRVLDSDPRGVAGSRGEFSGTPCEDKNSVGGDRRNSSCHIGPESPRDSPRLPATTPPTNRPQLRLVSEDGNEGLL